MVLLITRSRCNPRDILKILNFDLMITSLTQRENYHTKEILKANASDFTTSFNRRGKADDGLITLLTVIKTSLNNSTSNKERLIMICSIY